MSQKAKFDFSVALQIMKGKDKKMHVLRVFQLTYNMERKHLLVHKQDMISQKLNLFQAGEVSYISFTC